MFVCVLFPFHFCSVLFVIKEGKDMMLFCCCFVEVRIFIFYVLFFSFLCSCLYRDRPFFCAGGKFMYVCVCVCFISISFLFCLDCNKIREGYDVILLFFCWGPNLHFLCSLFLFFCSFLYRDWPFFCAECKFVCVFVFYFHFIFVRSCL